MNCLGPGALVAADHNTGMPARLWLVVAVKRATSTVIADHVFEEALVIDNTTCSLVGPVSAASLWWKDKKVTG